MSRCRCTAHFGVPVLPDVWSQKAASSAAVDAASSRVDALSTSLPKSCSSTWEAPPPTRTTCRRKGNWRRRSRSGAQNAGVVMITRARLSARRKLCSSGVTAKLIAVGTAPILIAPKNEVMNSGRLGSRIATRCSISTPSAARALPTWLTRPCSSANVTRSVSQTYAGRSPCPAAAAPSTNSTATFSMLGTSTGGDISTVVPAMAVPLLSLRTLGRSAAARSSRAPRDIGRAPRRLARTRACLRGLDGHGLDLYQQLGLHQPRDDQERVGRIDAAGKIAREELAPSLHEAVDVGGVGEEGLEPHHVGHGAARRRQHDPHVLEGLRGLGDHVPRPRHLAGAVGAHLPRHDHDLPGGHGHPVRVHAERRAQVPRGDRLGCHSCPSYPSRTYSKSTGRPLTPRAGGAIQLANLPGSTTGCIRLWMYSLSSSVGSQSRWRASHSAWLMMRPSGDTRTSPKL